MTLSGLPKNLLHSTQSNRILSVYKSESRIWYERAVITLDIKIAHNIVCLILILRGYRYLLFARSSQMK
jgi:hypothetical protein